ncbi:hypothetical protein IWX48DRAFT_607470 [Phyllosticta citricarpa]
MLVRPSHHFVFFRLVIFPCRGFGVSQHPSVPSRSPIPGSCRSLGVVWERRFRSSRPERRRNWRHDARGERERE